MHKFHIDYIGQEVDVSYSPDGITTSGIIVGISSPEEDEEYLLYFPKSFGGHREVSRKNLLYYDEFLFEKAFREKKCWWVSSPQIMLETIRPTFLNIGSILAQIRKHMEPK